MTAKSATTTGGIGLNTGGGEVSDMFTALCLTFVGAMVKRVLLKLPDGEYEYVGCGPNAVEFQVQKTGIFGDPTLRWPDAWKLPRRGETVCAIAEREIETIYCMVDLHAITVWQDPEQLKNNTRQLAAFYIASGLNPEKSILFNQSAVSEHAELGWIFNCVARMGWMKRMTQFKDKAGKNAEKRLSGCLDIRL